VGIAFEHRVPAVAVDAEGLGEQIDRVAPADAQRRARLHVENPVHLPSADQHFHGPGHRRTERAAASYRQLVNAAEDQPLRHVNARYAPAGARVVAVLVTGAFVDGFGPGIVALK